MTSDSAKLAIETVDILREMLMPTKLRSVDDHNRHERTIFFMLGRLEGLLRAIDNEHSPAVPLSPYPSVPWNTTHVPDVPGYTWAPNTTPVQGGSLTGGEDYPPPRFGSPEHMVEQMDALEHTGMPRGAQVDHPAVLPCEEP